ncbi:MAG: phosphotransferase [Prosthecobacter sp.]|uniref:phosphotransferase n=1 Tax=Prosthecobacter sp. TaxID=1965333 RepID=UPI0038FE4C64
MSRHDIYYWKCDRPAAFHGTQARVEEDAEMERQLREELSLHFDDQVDLSPGAGQGNHLTWNADVDGKAMFVRVENGPEKDDHLAIESAVLDRVRQAGVITPKVFGCDATRSRVPFAWQALERIAAPDLNHWFKLGNLDVSRIAFDIGQAVAKWQTITFEGFGVLEHDDVGRVWRQPARLFADDVEPGGSAKERNVSSESHPPNTPGLRGSRSSYADYFHLRLEEHLSFLVSRGFLTGTQRDEIAAEIESHQTLLDLPQGCLVHKDLALWNILGTRDQIAAFIDFDDAISGDPMDDLSLLGCFHDAAFLQRAFEGYQSIRALPEQHLRRFWLHLLRNMIVKAVIRVGAGYFDRDDGFFLIGSGSSGAELRRLTHEKLFHALHELRSM